MINEYNARLEKLERQCKLQRVGLAVLGLLLLSLIVSGGFSPVGVAIAAKIEKPMTLEELALSAPPHKKPDAVNRKPFVTDTIRARYIELVDNKQRVKLVISGNDGLKMLSDKGATMAELKFDGNDSVYLHVRSPYWNTPSVTIRNDSVSIYPNEQVFLSLSSNNEGGAEFAMYKKDNSQPKLALLGNSYESVALFGVKKDGTLFGNMQTIK